MREKIAILPTTKGLNNPLLVVMGILLKSGEDQLAHLIIKTMKKYISFETLLWLSFVFSLFGMIYLAQGHSNTVYIPISTWICSMVLLCLVNEKVI